MTYSTEKQKETKRKLKRFVTIICFLQSITALSKSEMKGPERLSLKNRQTEPFEKWKKQHEGRDER